MFASRSPRPTTSTPSTVTLDDISPVLAAKLATEYASLQAVSNCPMGMYIAPSTESLLRWDGVFFVHRGPYGGSVLRFTMLFAMEYPKIPPIIRFETDVFHPMIDPKSRIWHPRGRLAEWRPDLDHVPHLLHHLKASFKTKELSSVTEGETKNKQVWSLYHHSHQTFLSLTAQRTRASHSRETLYSASTSTRELASPSKRVQLTMDIEKSAIPFRELTSEEVDTLWATLQRSLRVSV